MKNKTKELLTILQEECAELIQAVSKIQRFGLENSHPDTLETNLDRLSSEIADVQLMIKLVVEELAISEHVILEKQHAKKIKLLKFSNIYSETK